MTHNFGKTLVVLNMSPMAIEHYYHTIETNVAHQNNSFHLVSITNAYLLIATFSFLRRK